MSRSGVGGGCVIAGFAKSEIEERVKKKYYRTTTESKG